MNHDLIFYSFFFHFLLSFSLVCLLLFYVVRASMHSLIAIH